MAEEKPTGTSESRNIPARELLGLNPAIPTVYANNTSVIVGVSDVSISLSYDMQPNDPNTVPVVRIVLSHDSFVRMAEYWMRRADLIKRLYGENAKSLTELINQNPEKFNSLWNEFFGSDQ